MNKKILFIILGLVVVAACGMFFSQKGKEEGQGILEVKKENLIAREKTLVIATVGDEIEEEKKEYQPFIDYIVSKLSDQGIVKGEVIVAATPAEMSKFIRQGKVDMYIDSPFPVYIVSKLAEAEVLVSRWKKGEEKYHSNIFVRKDSGITTLDELKGKTITFESAYSTSGYFLPKAELIKRGYILKEKKDRKEKVDPEEIGYYFTNKDYLVVEDVLNKKADAGAQNEKDLLKAAGDKISDLVNIFTSIDVYRHIIVVRKDLPVNIKDSLRKLLVEMHETEEGKIFLKNFEDTTRFGNLEESDPVFAGVRELSTLVENEIIRQ